MIIFNILDNYFVVSADSQTFLGFEMTANFRDTSPLKSSSRQGLHLLYQSGLKLGKYEMFELN